MPRDYINEKCCEQICTNNGRPAVPNRLAFATLFVRAHMGLSQERSVQEMKKNFYIRHFAGVNVFYNIPESGPSSLQTSQHTSAWRSRCLLLNTYVSVSSP